MLRDFKPFWSSQVYCLEDDAHGSFQSLFSLIFNAVMNNGLKAQAVVHALADAMYQLMLSWSDIGDRNPTVEHFQKVLLDNLSNREFDLSEEIRRTGYSSSYFRKLFNRFTGNSPIGYLNYMRIECAKRQIQHYLGTRSMKEIAHDSGFEDPYYFSRVFRKYTGANPLRYAKEIGEVKVQKVDGEPMAN
jgi:AraC-like DNA-binding protein